MMFNGLCCVCVMLSVVRFVLLFSVLYFVITAVIFALSYHLCGAAVCCVVC